MSATTAPAVTVTTVHGISYVDLPELSITVARFQKEGSTYRLRCHFGPEDGRDVVYSDHLTRASAKRSALRHAAKFA